MLYVLYQTLSITYQPPSTTPHILITALESISISSDSSKSSKSTPTLFLSMPLSILRCINWLSRAALLECTSAASSAGPTGTSSSSSSSSVLGGLLNGIGLRRRLWREDQWRREGGKIKLFVRPMWLSGIEIVQARIHERRKLDCVPRRLGLHCPLGVSKRSHWE